MDFIIYSIYLRKLEELQRFEKRISTPPFISILMAAFALHIILALGLTLMPKQDVIEVPVKQLSIHLGSGEQLAKRIEEANRSDAMFAAIASIVTVPEATLAPSAGSNSNDKNKQNQPIGTSETQQITTKTTTNTATTSPTQNPIIKKGSAEEDLHNKEIITRYEQTLSQWINRYKVYPEEAQRAGMQGRVMLRIRIDRSGYIKFIFIEESSGSPLLDQAVVQAAQKANPLPVVPTDYPGGSILEFIIPVRFALR